MNKLFIIKGVISRIHSVTTQKGIHLFHAGQSVMTAIPPNGLPRKIIKRVGF